ncbi:glycosyltransferase [Pseudotabrizicola algicola]|uniref:Glycosyltransferase family 4 protein n=1 Tax=Pseudotabrizicola algicola TaxID=2709381 RepID=A0A6B3RKP1_9RHOB|nr:glycosyltransferase [Pseudotabrizicola algicola]NEX46604.1 glycosyltransferase family 4 protein [Pseudotabrizicola algicola]
MKVAILAEQNFNLIDGSTIWLLNVCKLMGRLPDLEVTLLLSHPLIDPILAAEVPDRLRIVDAAEMARTTGLGFERLTADHLTAILRRWEATEGAFDRYFVRGADYLTVLLEDSRFRPRIVGYAPGAIPDLAVAEPDWLRLGRAARTPLVVQSEPAKWAMESLFDYPAHIVHVVPPIVFHDGQEAAPERDHAKTVLCYSGKIDLHYGIDWLIDLARRVADAPDLRISLIAGKDTWRTRYPEFFAAMDAFRTDVSEGRLGNVDLVTGVPHAEAKSRMARADFAWCLRHARYDDVIEISTKIVEFCTAGVVPILNDTALNRALFGDDYPYLVDIVSGDVEARMIDMLRSKGGHAHRRALARIAEVAAQFSADRLAGSLAAAIRGHAGGGVALVTQRRHVLLATHDPKFLRSFLDRVRGDASIRLEQETWRTTTTPENPPSVPAGVDTVFCEWACENAVWHSRNKRPGTKLVVRLHRFEAFRDFPKRVEWGAVDALIVVSDHFRDLMVQQFGIDPARIHVRPQYIDWHQLRRQKLPGSRFTLGLVGINPFGHKRFDRALDFLAALRAQDPRFRLVVRSVMPWKIDWVWNRDSEERAKFVEVFRRVQSDPLLAGAVRFDPAGPDMEEWFRGIGCILSSSDSEGCHTSVMEGMAAGCYPVVHDWPGARSLFGPYVHADMRDAIPEVIAFADRSDCSEAREQISQSMRGHDIDVFTRSFFQL